MIAKMGEPSLFFSGPANSMAPDGGLECIYRSEKGPGVLYRIQREGKFRVLKALKEEFRDDPFYRGLLRKEFEIGWELDHPGICKTFDYREVEGLGPCIELEWVDGGTLAEFYAHGPVDQALECQLFAEICDALAYVHHKQIYHRDLKPENILVTHNGSHIKLIDFGLSDSDTHAVHKESAGTVVYAAPEVLRGEPADARSDIYSLGRILFEVSDRYTALALRCMDLRPEKRPVSAEEVKAALFRPRHRWIWWIIVAAVLITSVLAGGYFFARGTHPAEPAPAVSSDKSDDNTSDVDALFEEVSNQIIDAQKKSN